MRPGEVVGLLVVRRRGAGQFSDGIVDLIKTFAAQSVLAIQNARLFNEINLKSRQLEAESKHKSQFVANMSHELRTPLNAILGYTELILDNIYGDPPEKMREVIERVQVNGRHLLGLINDVLDLAKIEAGQLSLSLADYSLKDVVDGVIVALEPLASEKRLAFKTDLPSATAGRTRGRASHCTGISELSRKRHQIHRRGRGCSYGLLLPMGRSRWPFRTPDTASGQKTRSEYSMNFNKPTAPPQKKGAGLAWDCRSLSEL